MFNSCRSLVVAYRDLFVLDIIIESQVVSAALRSFFWEMPTTGMFLPGVKSTSDSVASFDVGISTQSVQIIGS
jgi:hypothetical protein